MQCSDDDNKMNHSITIIGDGIENMQYDDAKGISTGISESVTEQY